MSRRWWPAAPLLVLLLLLPWPAAAEMVVPPGFTVQVYVTGEGFADGATLGAAGIPGTGTLAFDDFGVLYLARTGRRYTGGEADDLWPLYRIPVGGAHLSPQTESRFLHGPPLPNAQVAATRNGRELLVTTYDRDRRIGVLYSLVDGQAELLAGGTPPPGVPPLLRQPEGVAIDAAGRLYVADRAEGAIVRLSGGGVVDRRWISVTRPRLLALGPEGHLWVGSDGTAEAPWQRGPGEILQIAPDGTPRVVLRGPVPTAMAIAPGGPLFVADRQGSRIFVLDADGRRLEFARFTDGDAPRGLAFAPVTPQTRRAGFAGDLFVATIRRGTWRLNEITRISGPWDRLLGEPPPAAPR